MKKTIQQFVKEIEKELLVQIMTNLDSKKITEARAQRLAKEFLILLPVKNKKSLVVKMRALSNQYKEVAKVYFMLAEKLYKEERLRKSRLASKYIKRFEIDRALSAMKGGIFYG